MFRSEQMASKLSRTVTMRCCTGRGGTGMTTFLSSGAVSCGMPPNGTLYFSLACNNKGILSQEQLYFWELLIANE